MYDPIFFNLEKLSLLDILISTVCLRPSSGRRLVFY